MFKTILVPLDGSALGERALPVARELAGALSSKLVLVRVANAPAILAMGATEEDRRAVADQRAAIREEEHVLSTDPWAVERAQAQIRVIEEAGRYLAGVAEELAEEGIQAETAVPYGSAPDGILTEIGLHSADLVVMCRHNRPGLVMLLAGSVAQAVIARSPVPVLLVPPAERE